VRAGRRCCHVHYLHYLGVLVPAPCLVPLLQPLSHNSPLFSLFLPCFFVPPSLLCFPPLSPSSPPAPGCISPGKTLA
jgi:hypothetical protein